MELPKRKPNRLCEYDYSQNGAYFITVCTQNRARLFAAELPVGNGLCAVPDGANGFALANQIIHKWVKETEHKFPNMSIDKYVVMPDHLHFIITIKERHEGRSLWQKSYYDHVIRNQRDYDEVWQYIDNNPKKWILERQ